jgi:cold shock CspA family protein
MARSQESFNKKEVQNKKEKKRKEKEKKRLAKKESGKKSLDDMIAYVDKNGMITSTPPDLTEEDDFDIDSIEVSIPKRDNSERDDPIRKGVVSFFNDAKGFGFIKDSISKQDVFVHINNVTGEIKENNVVTFEVEMGPKGPTAINVKQLKN